MKDDEEEGNFEKGNEEIKKKKCENEEGKVIKLGRCNSGS